MVNGEDGGGVEGVGGGEEVGGGVEDVGEGVVVEGGVWGEKGVGVVEGLVVEVVMEGECDREWVEDVG